MCRALFFSKNIAQIFIKFTHSFVAIELLNFCNKAKKLFIAQESSWYSVHKQENVSQKIGFCTLMKIKMTAIIERQRALVYTQKAKKLRNDFIYKKPETFQKARQFPLRFYIQKAIHLTLRDFQENFELGIYIKNHDTLPYVTFLYTKG